MSEPNVADVVLEILERPYFDGQSFTARELHEIIDAEMALSKTPSVVSIGLRLTHLCKVGKVERIDSNHVVVRRST
jgi:hypothetical protein